MRRLFVCSILLAGCVAAQQPAIDANSIVVTANRSVVLAPTEATFMINVSAEIGISLEQVLAAVDLGLTAQDLVSINSYPIGPYPPRPDFSRITYVFRLTVPFSQMKDTMDKLEKLRKTVDTNMDLNYNTSVVGPNQAAVDDARGKALPEMVADARKRAQQLAAAAGLTLGAVQGVSEGYTYSGAPPGALPANVNFNIVVRFAAQ